MESEKRKKTETFEVAGNKVVGKVKEFIREGNVRKITIKNKEGKILASFPLTFGVIGAVIAPALALITAATVLVTQCTITVEREV